MKIEGDINIRSLIHKFQRGIRFLSNAHWVSASGFNVPVACILGVAGLILAIRDSKIRNLASLSWSSDRESVSEQLWVVPGLQNLGNNCFLNVILQALASCSCFQSFLQNIVDESQSSSVEELVETVPLAVALDTLLEELCNVRHGREVLSPRRVMLAMDHYIHNFNLSSQQDAEEAFFHILSSLREELSDFYVPNHSSLGDVTSLANCRIITPERRVFQSERERWQQSFLGPFDGILGSILTCQSCSFQISLDFQFFHSLHLSPVLSSDSTIMARYSLEDCLKQFFAAEQLENYRCCHCWHIAAIKYLSLIDGNETDVGKLRDCSKQGSCDCKNISRLGALPWSNSFSHTFKQLNVARSPKILCLHIQRASMDIFGELVKLQGHISFPLILNLSPFMNTGVGIKNCKENLPSGQSKQQYQPSFPHSNHLGVQRDTRMLNCIHEQMVSNNFSEAVVAEEIRPTAYEVSANKNMQAIQGDQTLFEAGSCSDIMLSTTPLQSDDKVGTTCELAVPSERHLYRLVSVVQHFGRAGSGHYTVYRRVRAKLNDDGSSDSLLSPPVHWFCISDSEVYSVSETDVLAAAASMLFYEKISQG